MCATEGSKPADVAERLMFGLLTMPDHLDNHVLRTKMDNALQPMKVGLE